MKKYQIRDVNTTIKRPILFFNNVVIYKVVPTFDWNTIGKLTFDIWTCLCLNYILR
jgi:hypothetical protein